MSLRYAQYVYVTPALVRDAEAFARWVSLCAREHLLRGDDVLLVVMTQEQLNRETQAMLDDEGDE